MQAPVPVSGIWLHSAGDDLHVCAEVFGRWHRLFTEHREGPISHIIEPAGIWKAPLETLGGKLERQVGHAPDTLGSEETGNLFIWGGALSGWEVTKHDDAVALTHRCGWWKLVGTDYLANLIMEHVIGHRCT